MKMQKNERGITLVALVVTIVVLLILAGVTIMYVMSDNGIFGKAQDAKEETNKGVVKDIVMNAVWEAQIEKFDPRDGESKVTDAASAGTLVTKRVNEAGITGTVTFTAFNETDDAGITGSGDLGYNGKTYTVTINTKAAEAENKFTVVEKTTTPGA